MLNVGQKIEKAAAAADPNKKHGNTGKTGVRNNHRKKMKRLTNNFDYSLLLCRKKVAICNHNILQTNWSHNKG